MLSRESRLDRRRGCCFLSVCSFSMSLLFETSPYKMTKDKREWLQDVRFFNDHFFSSSLYEDNVNSTTYKRMSIIISFSSTRSRM